MFPGPESGVFTASGHNGLTAGGGGTLTLVAPVVVTQTTAITGRKASSAFAARLTLSFAPEPDLVGLLAAGALLGGVRSRRRAVRSARRPR